MMKFPFDWDTYGEDAALLIEADEKSVPSCVLVEIEKINEEYKKLVKTDEQRDSAFMIFFGHQNDYRNYNALKKHQHYSNICNYSLTKLDFSSDDDDYSGEIYSTINSFIVKNPDVKKINILLNGTGGQHKHAMELNKYLREKFNEINVFVFGNAASALGMIALAADNFYVKEGSKYKKGKSASIGKFDVQIKNWLNSGERLDPNNARQVSLEKLLAAYVDSDDLESKDSGDYREKIIKFGHKYLLEDPFKEYWKKEFEKLIDDKNIEEDGLTVLNKLIEDKHVESMFETYEYFSEEINKRHKPINKNGTEYKTMDILTSPTFDLMAMLGLGKGIFHHGSRIYSYQFERIGINYKKIIVDESKPDSFFEILRKIDNLCCDLLKFDDIKKVFVFSAPSKNALKSMVGTEKIPGSKKINNVNDFFNEINNLAKLAHKEYKFAFRGQSKDYGNIKPSVFREIEYTDNGQVKYINNADYEDKRYEDSLEYCIDIFNEDVMPERTVSFATPLNLSKQQHYGIPTRLTDLSLCPLIALYMACSNDGKKDYLEFNELNNTPTSDEEPCHLSQNDGIIYVFPYCDRDYNSIFAEQKVLFLSQLVKLSKNEKNLLFLVMEIINRYSRLLKRYLDYIYHAHMLTPNKNFLHSNFNGLYPDIENPYITSLKILIKKINELDESCFQPNGHLLNDYFPRIKEGLHDIICRLMGAIKNFTEYEDENYPTKKVEISSYLKCFYLELDVIFFDLTCKILKNDNILEKIFGKLPVEEGRRKLYANFLFELDDETVFIPDYSIAANARLKKQKGLFLISGSEDKISTKSYYKLSIGKEAKKNILEELKDKVYLEKLTQNSTCSANGKPCKNCHEGGINFPYVYGDLYGMSKYIEKCNEFCESHK